MYTSWCYTTWCTLFSLSFTSYFLVVFLGGGVVSGRHTTSPMSWKGSSVESTGVNCAEGAVLWLLPVLEVGVSTLFSGGGITIPSGWKILGWHDDIAPNATLSQLLLEPLCLTLALWTGACAVALVVTLGGIIVYAVGLSYLAPYAFECLADVFALFHITCSYWLFLFSSPALPFSSTPTSPMSSLWSSSLPLGATFSLPLRNGVKVVSELPIYPSSSSWL